ncbi:MAG TPA: GntR family transcriptional regulator [Methylomirabilota bacterium]|nr:GntR family transcriptional regulator [Methylomirabilota bacterium]
MDRTQVVEPLKRQRLVDEATKALREAILSGRFPEGTRLRQTDLADRLRISRTPIRQALVRLQHEGLVQLLPASGVRVTVLDLHEGAELYDLREVLDGLAARLAATRATAAALARIERALARMRQCLERNDANRWFAAHVAFHDEIFQAGGNARLQSLSAVVRLSIQRFHPLLLTTPHRLEDAYREHQGIGEAIAAHDAAGAERLARLHITNARAIVLATMAGQKASDGAVQG